MIKQKLNDCGPSILSCIHEILEYIESNDDEIQNIVWFYISLKDFSKTVSEEHCLNMRDIVFNRMKVFKKDQTKNHYFRKTNTDTVIKTSKIYF